MSDNLRQRILGALGRDGADFTVNGGGEATLRVKNAVAKENWDALLPRAKKRPASSRPVYHRELNEHLDALKRMNANKDVTVLMPAHTRLSFVKTAVKRLNMATTRFQEDFNTASFDAAGALAEYAADAQKKLEALQKQVDRQNAIIERLMEEQTKLLKAVEELRRER